MIKTHQDNNIGFADDVRLILLFVVQAVPMGIAWLGMPAYLRSEGFDLTQISAIALCVMPWALKFIWASYIEKFCIAYSCRRFLICTQILLAIAFVVLAQISVTAEFQSTIVLLVVLNTLGATQDIGTDRYAIMRRGIVGANRINIARFAGFTLGMLLGGSGLLLSIAYFSWYGFCLICAAIMLLVPLALAGMQEVDANPAKVKVSLRNFLSQKYAWSMLLIAFLFKSAYSLTDNMLKSFWVDHGVTLDQISIITTIYLALLGLVAAPLGAWLINRNRTGIDARENFINASLKVAIYSGLGVSIVFIVLGLAIFYGIGITQLPQHDWIFVVLPAVNTVFDGIAAMAFFAMFVHWSVGNQPGTNFSLFLCAESLGSIVFASLSGTIASQLGYALHFLSAAVFFLAVLVLLNYLVKRINHYHLGQSTEDSNVDLQQVH